MIDSFTAPDAEIADSTGMKRREADLGEVLLLAGIGSAPKRHKQEGTLLLGSKSLSDMLFSQSTKCVELQKDMISRRPVHFPNGNPTRLTQPRCHWKKLAGAWGPAAHWRQGRVPLGGLPAKASAGPLGQWACWVLKSNKGRRAANQKGMLSSSLVRIRADLNTMGKLFAPGHPEDLGFSSPRLGFSKHVRFPLEREAGDVA